MKNLSNGVIVRKLEETHFNNKLLPKQIVLETQKSLYNFFQYYEIDAFLDSYLWTQFY